MRQIFDIVRQTIDAATTPEPNARSVFRRCRVGPVIFDQMRGEAATMINAQLDQRGFVAMIRPSEFFGLIGDDLAYFEDRAGYTEQLQHGVPIASPYLSVNIASPLPVVHGHEGRHRMGSISSLCGDVAVPVGIHVLGELGASRTIVRDFTKFAGPIVPQGGGLFTPHNIKTFYFRGAQFEMGPLLREKQVHQPQ